MALALRRGRDLYRHGPDRIETQVEVGGTLSNNKGLNVPDVVLPMAALTEKDRSDLAFAVEQGVDWIALSFVQRPEDLAEARKLIGGKAALLAKIEKPAAIDRLEEIVEMCDGVMVARDYVLVDYDIERSRLDAAISIARGFESATVSPLQREGWVAVRVMVRRDDTNQIMDALDDVGATAIIVSRIHAARL